MPKDDTIKFRHYNNINQFNIRIYGAFETLNDLSMKHKSKNGKTTFETGQQPASFEIIEVSDTYIEGYTKVMGRWYPYHKVQAGREQHDITTYKHEGLDSANVFMRTVLQLIIRKSNIRITIQNWNVSVSIILHYLMIVKIAVIFHNLTYDKNVFIKRTSSLVSSSAIK